MNAPLHLLPAAGHRRMPWKNGGGETAEIALSPPGAALDAFDWRVSMATVASDGPFSRFPDVDRTLTVLEGGGLSLAVDGRPPTALTPASPPFSFPGDAATGSTLLDGPVVDLNVMTRRGRCRHAVESLHLDGERALSVGGHAVLLLCVAGNVDVTAGAEAARLGPLDGLLAEDPGEGRWRLRAERPARLFVIRIHGASGGGAP